MAFLSFLRKRNPAIDETQARQQYSQSRYRGAGFKGIRLMTPEEEQSKRGALPAEQAPSNRVLSPEGQARANSMATNDPAIVGTRDPVTGEMVGGAAQANGMRGFYEKKTAPYGVSEQGKVLAAPEYAASVGRGTAGGIRRFRTDEASRLQDKQYGLGLKAYTEGEQARADAAMGIAAARMGAGDGTKVVQPGGTVVDANGNPVYQAPQKPVELDKDVLGTIAGLEAEKTRIAQSGDLKGKSGPNWNPLARTRQERIDELDAQIGALRGTTTKQPSAQVDYQTADELIAAYENGKIDRATAEAIIKAKGW